MKRILVAVAVNEAQKENLLAAAGDKAELIFANRSEITDELLKSVDGIIGNVDPGLLSDNHHIKWVQLNSAGMDKYVLPGVLAEDCKLYNAVGAYGRSVSEHMLGLTFSLTKRLDQYSQNKQQSLWRDEGEVLDIENSTVLVIGLGDIGGTYARKMKALGAYVIGVRHSEKTKPEYVDEQYVMTDLKKAVQKADIIASVLPSTEETKGIFHQEFFSSCKKGAYFINCGRGDAVNQEDLLEALQSGTLAGAALDVTTPEPLPAEHPLWQCDRVIITPHVAGGFHIPYTMDRIIEMACERMKEWLE